MSASTSRASGFGSQAHSRRASLGSPASASTAASNSPWFSPSPGGSPRSSVFTTTSSRSSSEDGVLCTSGPLIGHTSSRRVKSQRRFLNRVALALPRRLQPLAHSLWRLSALVAVLLLLFLLAVSLVSPVPPPAQLSSFQSSFAKHIAKRHEAQAVLAPPHDHGVQDSIKSQHNDSQHDSDAIELQKPAERVRESVKEVVKIREVKVDRCPSRRCDPEGYEKGNDTLKHPFPQARFRDNFLDDHKYLTFGLANGFSTQQLTVANGIYLAKLADRVPIVPPFAAGQNMDRHAAGYLGFSKIFDIGYLEMMLRHPVQDWQNVKQSAEQVAKFGDHVNEEFQDEDVRRKSLGSVKREKISCWSLWAVQMPEPGKPAGSAVQNHLGLDIEYWQAPSHYTNPPKDRHMRYWDLVLLDQDVDEAKTTHLSKLAESKRQELSKESGSDKGLAKLSPPDDQLLCFDTLYYMAATGSREWWQPHAPVWKAVGRYMKWHPDVSAAVDGQITKMLKKDQKAKTSKFIAVHIRRGDFSKHCKGGSDCLPSLDMYRSAVQRVRDQVLDKTSTYVKSVIVTTDEADGAFLEKISKLGWHVVNHDELGTVEKYGSIWWPVIFDVVLHSKAVGFVGTDKSLMSLMAYKRVADWNKGPVELVPLAH